MSNPNANSNNGAQGTYGTYDRVEHVQGQANEVRGQLGQALGKAIERGERIEDLDEKAQNLEVSSTLMCCICVAVFFSFFFVFFCPVYQVS
jgi:Synaptobrevin